MNSGKVDGGRYKLGSYTHPDAEVIAAVPRCVPVEMKRNRHGDRAETVVVGTERIRVQGPTPRGTWKTVEILACQATYSPYPQQIGSARKAYDDWWAALGCVRDGLSAGGMLREVEVTGVMPKMRPWETG